MTRNMGKSRTKCTLLTSLIAFPANHIDACTHRHMVKVVSYLLSHFPFKILSVMENRALYKVKIDVPYERLDYEINYLLTEVLQ